LTWTEQIEKVTDGKPKIEVHRVNGGAKRARLGHLKVSQRVKKVEGMLNICSWLHFLMHKGSFKIGQSQMAHM
jgi:hypothetical protein